MNSDTDIECPTGHSNEQQPRNLRERHREPKCAALLNDRLYPMPRSEVTARTILEQAGFGTEYVLVRDYSGPHDLTLSDDETVDLRKGNVFNAVLRCENVPNTVCNEQPKLAYSINDTWEMTLNPGQTRETLIRLFGLPTDVELVRDFESPNDEIIKDGASASFSEGAVLLARKLSISVTINNRPDPVRFTKRRVTGLEIKQTAIAQGVPIEAGFVLYRSAPDGSLSPSIGNDEVVILKDCDAFSCVASDDVS